MEEENFINIPGYNNLIPNSEYVSLTGDIIRLYIVDNTTNPDNVVQYICKITRDILEGKSLSQKGEDAPLEKLITNYSHDNNLFNLIAQKNSYIINKLKDYVPYSVNFVAQKGIMKNDVFQKQYEMMLMLPKLPIPKDTPGLHSALKIYPEYAKDMTKEMRLQTLSEFAQRIFEGFTFTSRAGSLIDYERFNYIPIIKEELPVQLYAWFTCVAMIRAQNQPQHFSTVVEVQPQNDAQNILENFKSDVIN